MSKLQYQCTMSLDGYIAGPGGDMSWLSGHTGPDPIMTDLFPEVGAILAGANTFRGDDPNKGTENEGAYNGQFDGPAVVLTHHIPDAPVPGVAFADNLDHAVALAKEAADGRNVSVLGADVARQCIEAGILDEVLIVIAPVLLGDGVRLYHRPDGTAVKLDVLRSTGLSVLARVVY